MSTAPGTAPLPDDDQLVAQARSGDAQALDALLRRCQPDLRRYARRHCASEDVDDAVQDALWILARRVSALRAAAALSSWLFVTMRRICHRLLRQRHDTEPLDDERHGGSAPSQDLLRLDLARAISALAPMYREMLVRVDVLGHTVPEAAEALAIGLEAAKSRLHRARATLRESLQG